MTILNLWKQRKRITVLSYMALLTAFLSIACQGSTAIPDDRTRNAADSTIIDSTERAPLTVKEVAPKINLDSILHGHDSSWVDLTKILPKAKFDIRYASTNNFMGLQVYECAGCFTRLEVAKALIKIQADLDTLGLVLKFFDCYRPSAAQWKLWNKMPDPRYVHPPTQGSMHSRGNALDLTLVVDSSSQELEMGTPFDYFGKEAYWNYTAHPKQVNENRKLLRSIMYKYGFVTVATEWWHFAYNHKKFPLSNMQWTCEHH